jgi:hypothetical protein
MADVNVVVHHSSTTGAAANPRALVDGPKWDAAHVATVTGLENVVNLDTTNPTNITFTQTGTGATPITLDAIFRGKIYIPEMFGAAPSPAGTAASGVADSTSGLQRCINELQRVGGGTMLLGPGVYAYSDLLISKKSIYIIGSGEQATTLLHKPTANGQGVRFADASNDILFNLGLFNLSIGSADTTYLKYAVDALDVSNFHIDHVTVAFYPQDGTLFRGGGGSTGVRVRGREKGTVENFTVYAEQPISININPHSTISLDSWVFKNQNLIGHLDTSSSLPLILCQDGINVTNSFFCGTQNWSGGTDGFKWIATTASQISAGLYFSGIKSEQSPDAVAGSTAYTINIQTNTGLSGLVIAESIAGDRNGVKLRGARNPKISGFTFGPVIPNLRGLDIDATCGTVEIGACTWYTTTTALFGSGATLINAVQKSEIPAGMNLSSAIPPRAFYSTGTTETVGNITLSTSGVGGAALQIASGKSPSIQNSINFIGTDAKNYTFPTTDATLARTDAAQTFAGTQTFSSTIAGSISGSAPAGSLTGATLASNVLASSLTSVGTLTGGATGGGFTVALGTSTLTGQVPLANGGTAANLTASNGGILYSTASAGAILAGTATARQMLQSGATAAPAWSTATWPATTTINQLLYSSSANAVAGLATANSSVLVTDSGGVPSLSTTLPNIAHGTPTSITLTNATGTAASLTAGNATNTAITDDTTTNATMYPTWVTASTGNLPQKTSSTKLSFNPSTGNLISTSFGNIALSTSSVATAALNIGSSKSVGINNSLTLSGTDGTTQTFPTTSATIARTDAAQTFTGVQTFTNPIVGTQTANDNSTKAASTAYADAIAALKANLASPIFTGTPAAPTAAVDTNTTQLATTAMVLGQAASATPLINGTATVGTSTRYARADHVHPTDTTRAALVSPSFTTPSLGVATATSINGVTLDNNAWTAYTATLSSVAGGAIGTPTSTAGTYKQIGKIVYYRVKIVMGASGLGTATQIAISLPVTAVGDNELTAKNITSGLGGTGSIGEVSQTVALLQTSAGARLGGNNDTMVISGSYEA